MLSHVTAPATFGDFLALLILARIKGQRTVHCSIIKLVAWSTKRNMFLHKYYDVARAVFCTLGKGKGKVSVTSLGRPIRPALISGFRSMKRLGVFILPPGWDASPSQGYPQHYASTHSYTWVERGTVRVKCLAQEHNTISPDPGHSIRS